MFKRSIERKSNRLKNYDYSQNGYYFVTLCTKNMQPFFGEIKDEKVFLNESGLIVKACWLNLPQHYANIKLEEFVIMPNHFHGIVIIENPVGNGFKPLPRTHGLSEIIRGFKTFSARNINQQDGENLFQWQKSFYDKIILDELTLKNIRQYIVNNPLSWYLEKNCVENIP